MIHPNKESLMKLVDAYKIFQSAQVAFERETGIREICSTGLQISADDNIDLRELGFKLCVELDESTRAHEVVYINGVRVVTIISKVNS